MWENKLSLSWNGLGRLAVSMREENNGELPDLRGKAVDKRKGGLALQKENKVAAGNEMVVSG